MGAEAEGIEGKVNKEKAREERPGPVKARGEKASGRQGASATAVAGPQGTNCLCHHPPFPWTKVIPGGLLRFRENAGLLQLLVTPAHPFNCSHPP